jgi:putative transposon-encoded protein
MYYLTYEIQKLKSMDEVVFEKTWEEFGNSTFARIAREKLLKNKYIRNVSEVLCNF